MRFTKTLLVILCFAHLSVSGQELKKEDLDSNWKLLSEQDGLQMFIRSETCQIQGAPKPFEYAFIKLTNNSSVDKTIDLQLGMNYNGDCIGCSLDDLEAKRKVFLPANASVEGDATFERGELSYLISNQNSPNPYSFKSIRVIYLKIQ